MQPSFPVHRSEGRAIKQINDSNGPAKRTSDGKLFFLILSCSGGAGHLRAAEALHRTAARTGLPVRTEHYDVLDFTSKLFKRAYSGSYLQMVNRAPELWGYLYQQSEKRPYEKKGIVRSFDKVNYRRYLRSLRAMKPDAVLCTHFLPYISISGDLRSGGIDAPFFAVTTDYDVHQLWVDPLIERYYVFHPESAWQLQSKHVEEGKIRVAGIPVMPEFTAKRKPGAVRKSLGLAPDRFTVLVLSGGFGIGRVREIVEGTASTLGSHPEKQFNLIVVCGKNENVRASVEAMMFPANTHPRIFGFVNTIHDLMDAADLLISKSGGLTSSEALAKSLPMIIIDPIPGQESRNADMLVEHQAGWKAINLPNLSYKLTQILNTPSLLVTARAAAGQLARPDAAETILRDVYAYIRERKRER